MRISSDKSRYIEWNGSVFLLYFRNDYSAGACPQVLEALCNTNNDLTAGYGCDSYCESAAETIRALCGCSNADIHFLMGGTQANKTAIGAFLRPFEAVIAASTAHICVHETGSIEHNGHKIIHCPTADGKLTPDVIRTVANNHSSEHMVVPKLVYISNTTEVGRIYSASELDAMAAVSRELGLYLYCDGARLGSAIAAGDAGFSDYSRYCDAFTIGGTKNGLLFGEALVIVNPDLQPGFRHCMKQQGAVLAKGRLLGVQFGAIFKDNLFINIAANENALAQRLTRELTSMGVPFLVESLSNQIFPILPDAVVEKLAQEVAFEIQEKTDETHTCIRLVTGWQTTDADVGGIIAVLAKLIV